MKIKSFFVNVFLAKAITANLRSKKSAILAALIINYFICGFGGFNMIVEAKPGVKKAPFGKATDGKSVEIYTLTNSNGAEARIMTYGGTVVSLTMPDKKGNFTDVVLGYDALDGYLGNNSTYLGALIGRYGNRIAKGKFTLDGKEYNLATNNGANHLHGGAKGFDKVVWTAKNSTDQNGANLELTYFSKDGEEGYPGNLTARVVYSLTENNELKIVYSATTDKETIVNLTHHSYFNLAGAGNGDVLKHQLQINADRFTPVGDGGSIPTGELKSVKGTPFDFTRSAEIGARIAQSDDQLKFGSGYDHNFVLNKTGNSLTKAATVYEPTSGRVLEVFTSEPGLQFYSGNFLDGTIAGKGGKVYQKHFGFCLEAQHFPDSPNEATFPSTVLKPGQRYSQTTVYKFSTR